MKGCDKSIYQQRTVNVDVDVEYVSHFSTHHLYRRERERERESQSEKDREEEKHRERQGTHRETQREREQLKFDA